MWRALLIVAVLAGCAPRATLVEAPGLAGLPTQMVFVKSQRAQDAETGTPTVERAETPTFRRFDITLPPQRTTGEVSFPKGKRTDPERHMLVAQSESYASNTAFLGAISREFRRAEEQEMLLYVHGYNNTFADGVLRAAQMADDFNYAGVPAHFAWASSGTALGYAYDRESIMTVRLSLQNLIEDLSRISGRRLTVVAHSVGTNLVMEVLRDLAISGRRDVLDALNGVILISPDIDVDVFRSQVNRIGNLPDPFVIITSPNDRALTVSARLTGRISRVGTLPNLQELADFNIIVIDVSAQSQEGDVLGHFTAATSPEAIMLIRQLSKTAAALGQDMALRPGLIPGTVIRSRQATRIILGGP